MIRFSRTGYTRVILGKKGEALAVSHLQKNGYKIVAKNYKTKLGEVDIIANDGDCVCFIEVRSKSSSQFGLPQESITRHKQLQIAKSALWYIKKNNIEDKLARFDVVCIEDIDSPAPKIDIIKNAFELDERYKY